jgi:hypothetical protein
MSPGELSGEIGAGQFDGTGRGDLPEDPGGLSCGDLLGDAAGNQVAEHGVQPAGDLVTQPGQVPVTLSPHLQHCRVVLGGHLAAGPGPQRRDRHGQGIVRVVFIRVASLQQPHPRCQLRLNVQDPLAGGDELLGKQAAQPGSAPGRPGPLRPRRRPLRQLPGLRSRCADPDLARRLFRRADHHGRVRGLMRVHADHHCCHGTLQVVRREWRTWRACLIYGSASVRTSSGPRHGKNRQAGTSI